MRSFKDKLCKCIVCYSNRAVSGLAMRNSENEKKKRSKIIKKFMTFMTYLLFSHSITISIKEYFITL